MADNSGGANAVMKKAATKKILIVIDVQNCFLPGGSLATSGDTIENFTNAINSLIISNQFDDVYLSQDMHHPNNISMANTQNIKKLESEGNVITLASGLKLHTKMYELDKMNGNRRWQENEGLVAQVLWPRHCIVPPTDPFYPGQPSNPSTNVKNMRVNKSTPVVNMVGKEFGSDLAGVLNKYKDTKPDDITSTIYHVYKGFSPDRDSYSAIADAYGNFDPFIAKIDGVAQPTMDTKFAEKLLADDDISDIYICGIARDYCVFWTAMDLLDLVVFGKNGALTNKPKIHYIYNLTREVAPGMNESKLVSEAENCLVKAGQSKDDVSKYFVVEESSTLFTTSGGRRRTRHRGRRSAHHKRSTKRSHKRCHCGKPRGHKGYRSCQ